MRSVCAETSEICDVGTVVIDVKETEGTHTYLRSLVLPPSTGNIVCHDDALLTSFETATVIYVLANDKVLSGGIDVSSLAILRSPQSGEASQSPDYPGRITYAPNEGFVGIDSFLYHGTLPTCAPPTTNTHLLSITNPLYLLQQYAPTKRIATAKEGNAIMPPSQSTYSHRPYRAWNAARKCGYLKARW